MPNQVNPITGQPVAPNPYPNAPIPYNNSKEAAKHAFAVAKSALRDQRRDTLNYYGYNMHKGRPVLDPFNQYGAAQMLNRTQGQEIQDLSSAQAEAGLIGPGVGASGLARSQRNQALFAQGAEQQRLLKEFQDKMQSIRLGMREAKWQKRHDEASGTLQSILNAIAAGQFTPAAPVY